MSTGLASDQQGREGFFSQGKGAGTQGEEQRNCRKEQNTWDYQRYSAEREEYQH